MAASDHNDRRTFWKRQMDEGARFMDSVLLYPVAECGDRLCSLRDRVDEAGVQVGFADTEIAPGLARQFVLREGLLDQFIAIARTMNERGWILKVEDAFRDREMQKQLALKVEVAEKVARLLLWECGGKRPPSALISERLKVLIAHCPKTGTHMSGSALDISVLSREDGTEVGRGAPYLELSELTPMSSPFVSAECANARRDISAVMHAHGFVAYPYEFWHYSSGDAMAELILGNDMPGRYGPVDMDTVETPPRPIEDPEAPLSTEDEIVERVERAMAQLEGAAS